MLSWRCSETGGVHDAPNPPVGVSSVEVPAKHIMSTLKVTATGVPIIVGVSKAIRDVLQLVDQVAATDCCVLIEGESGTGKELIARRLFAKSQRADRPFIPVNCAGISESLFESQFFGHVRGAFTGAEQTMLGVFRTAEGGTVFLDEICEFPLSLQPKLLRVLQEHEVMPVGKPVPVKVDTRFLAGSNQNLAEMVRLGTFRRDLYHRLNIVRIQLPALRERPEDISPLLDHFLLVAADRYHRPPVVLPPQVPRDLDELRMAGQHPRTVRLGRAALRHRPVAGDAPGHVDGRVEPNGHVRPGRSIDAEAGRTPGDRAGHGACQFQPAQGGPHASGSSGNSGPQAQVAQTGLRSGVERTGHVEKTGRNYLTAEEGVVGMRECHAPCA